ncbi:MAG: zinc protease [Tenuifilum sp.]|jgi:predicted Zn-dependent peptidase|uniref:M16 family metallopeptidase n=1 Tax=Tenuifilum sp. TaxID=2760880 RepID=UPI0024AC3F07|nr:pitrilysin family protein [Tenuifilum sp.]MDI3527665.1 zinc protease [Tenuifilum sp.]
MAIKELDRTVQPNIKPVSKINIPKPEIIELSNGFKVISAKAGSQDLIKIEVIFRAGTRYQSKSLVAKASISNLREGTKKRSSKQIAEELDFYGSFIEPSINRDFASVSFYTTGKHFFKSFDVFSDLLLNPTFPEHELDIFRQKGKQSLLVEMEKVSTLSRMGFYKALFGDNHPYGTFALPHDYEMIERDDLVNFSNKFYKGKGGAIVITGNFDSEQLDFIKGSFASSRFDGQTDEEYILPRIKSNEKKIFTYKNEAVQASIRIGRIFPERTHPDMPALQILNTILGGYFGSRLMRNIREDKGYTYGINSFIVPHSYLSVFVVSTEVGNNFVEHTISEIKKEIQRLKSEPVSNDELNLVKGYMIGQVLRTFDGPFAIADSLAGLFEYNNFDFDYISNTINTINSVTPEQLMELAGKYFDTDSMVYSVSGSQIPDGFTQNTF